MKNKAPARKIVFVHGIGTNGDDDIFRMIDYMEGQAEENMDDEPPNLHEFKYGPISARKARDEEFLQETALRLIKEAGHGCHLICHSHAANVAYKAMELGLKAKTVILFAPAIEVYRAVPKKGCEAMYVIHNPRDRAILAGIFMVWHRFGAMGRDGYQGPPDSRIVNIEAEPMATPGIFKHSGWFTEPDLGEWVQRIQGWLKK